MSNVDYMTALALFGVCFFFTPLMAEVKSKKIMTALIVFGFINCAPLFFYAWVRALT